ncbi:hypothetical protein V5F79_01295 [Xanthobacter flavus]|uniref:hypothetical protein n=1 Tax=Xanthobacter flavus TaxID=281 RepID=UPI003727667F
MSAPHWLGPYKDATTALNELRKSVAEIIGADPETWPDHGNAPLAIAATLALARRTHPAPAQPVAVPTGIEAAAAFLAKAAFGTCYASLRGDGSIRERGFEPVVYSTWGGQIFQGTKRDMDDLAREVVRLAAPVSPPVEAQGEALKCFICREPILKGQLVLPDYTEGLGHRECFGSDRDGFCNLETGEPLGPDEPLPPGEPYEPDAAHVTPPAESGEVERLFGLAWDMAVAIRGGGPLPHRTPAEVANEAAPYLLKLRATFASTPAPQPGGAEAVKEAIAKAFEARAPELSGSDYGLASEAERSDMREDAGRAYDNAAFVRRLAVPAVDPSPTHRHVKRGSEYRVIGEAEAQVSTGDYRPDWTIERLIADGDRLTIYQGADGKLWARFTDEFNDGRFVAIEAEA